MKTPKRKLKPSWEVHSRILWDPKLNQLAFYIGYEDRMFKHALGEKLLIDWADNDIPWNRVQYIRCADTIVWDRAKRVDLFEEDQLPIEAYLIEKSTVKNTVIIDGVSIVNKPVFNNNKIQPQQPITAVDSVLKQLKLVSFNLLTDKFNPEIVCSGQRMPAILKHLLEVDADILLLQEVDAPMLKLLLEADWGTVLYSSDLKRTTNTYYQELVILSKYPFSLMECQYSTQKKFPIASWLINGQRLHIANVHLSSNRSSKAQVIRKEQLSILLNYLDRLEGIKLIAGDFNCRGNEGLGILEQYQFLDAWTDLYPSENGYTFEPEHNPLAYQSTLTGLSARFDRIYLQQKNKQHWLPEEAVLFANHPLEDHDTLFASDHYGLFVTLSTPKQDPTSHPVESKWSTILASHRSALVIIPPAHLWAPIQKIRQQFDGKAQRWMPHITLVYEFLPDRYFEEIARELSPLLQSFKPFELSLERYQLFAQKETITAWLEPIVNEDAFLLKALQKMLQAHFIMKSRQRKSNASFTPHLSIGQFKSEEEALSKLPNWKAMNVEVTQVALISRRQQEAFQIRYTIELGSGNVLPLRTIKSLEQQLIDLLNRKEVMLSLEKEQLQEVTKEIIAELCSSILGCLTPLYSLGSVALGTQITSSDIDLLCAIPKEMELLTFLEDLLKKAKGWYQTARLISDAKVPILKLEIEGIHVDLLCVNYPSAFIKMEDLSVKHRRYFSPQNWQAVSGILEVQSLLK